jgi:hypothetical protein
MSLAEDQTRNPPTSPIDPLDRPIWGTRDIAIAANLLREDGEPDLQKAFRLLRTGALPATKVRDAWMTTPRRLIERFNQKDTERRPGRGAKPGAKPKAKPGAKLRAKPKAA